MSAWHWVGFAYLVAYGVLVAYVGSIVARMRSTRRAIGDDA